MKGTDQVPRDRQEMPPRCLPVREIQDSKRVPISQRAQHHRDVLKLTGAGEEN
jgi:hypothetical protein